MQRDYENKNGIESEMTAKHHCCRPFPPARGTESVSAEVALLMQLRLQRYLIWAVEAERKNPV